ncbi:MAG TPA: helix-turn-helix domain-containing protein [Gammaproteobacteria bacterium]|nr:helix-turn-helix domain-containing protein [Gammaproteobacteria bacterium]
MAESQELLSVFEIANRLKLHVKTVRNYVREGRLKAVRIGKQYRIARADLEAFTGAPLPLTDGERAKRQRHVTTSCVVEIDAISPESSSRLESDLKAFAHRAGGGEEQFRVEAIYDRDIGHLKLMLFGGAAGTASALMLIVALLKK